MADLTQRRPENAAGDFFVDATCIDCDTCRWMAPATFASAGEQSAVHRQPATEAEVGEALAALVACPTASIGTVERHDLRPVLARFPLPVDGPVHHCGYHDVKSFGATSYLVVRARGNLLIDVPRFSKPLVRRIEELGGVASLFLTHRDDVGDHELWAAHFGCPRVIHEADAVGASFERRITGTAPAALDEEALVIPVPGHTRGSACLLFRRKYLFSGDHLAWSEELEQPYAFRGACWYDWDEQIASMRRLAEQEFEWILPGHGRRCRYGVGEMKEQMAKCIAWMEG